MFWEGLAGCLVGGVVVCGLGVFAVWFVGASFGAPCWFFPSRRRFCHALWCLASRWSTGVSHCSAARITFADSPLSALPASSSCGENPLRPTLRPIVWAPRGDLVVFHVCE